MNNLTTGHDPFWLVNFYWLFWLGLAIATSIFFGFIILRPVVTNRFVNPTEGQGYQ